MKKKFKINKDLIKIILAIVLFITSFFVGKYDLLCIFIAYFLVSMELIVDVAKTLVKGKYLMKSF